MRLLRPLLAVGLLVVLAGAGGWFWLQSYLQAPLGPAAADVVLDVPEGSSLRAVAERLASQDLLKYPDALAWYGRVTGVAAKIKAGEYALDPELTRHGLLNRLVAGQVKLHALTIVEGWTVRELLGALRAHPAIRVTLDASDATLLAAELGLQRPQAEGLFFPDTYRFARGTTDVQLLEQAAELMRQRLDEAWAGRASQLPFDDPYAALILASVVERETALESERAKIAGVFVRRLRLGMRLQTDPSVIYGLGEAFDGNLTRADLARDTPYNTYTRAGLPPTPIALPGEASLRAATHPEPGDALYFVATGLPDGSHYFTATLEEHNAAVARYLARLRSGAGEG